MVCQVFPLSPTFTAHLLVNIHVLCGLRVCSDWPTEDKYYLLKVKTDAPVHLLSCAEVFVFDVT